MMQTMSITNITSLPVSRHPVSSESDMSTWMQLVGFGLWIHGTAVVSYLRIGNPDSFHLRHLLNTLRPEI